MRRATKLALLTMVIAVAPAAVAQATQTAGPTSLRFPATTVGTESAPLTITYSITPDEGFRSTDVGNDCTIQQIVTCAFRVTSDCPRTTSFPPGEAHSCTIQVYFRPKLVGGAAQNILITPTTKVPVSGVGLAAASKGGKKCKKKGKKGAAAAKKKKCGKKKKK